jgi:hypothetical protein
MGVAELRVIVLPGNQYQMGTMLQENLARCGFSVD